MITPMRGEIWPLMRLPLKVSFPRSSRCQDLSLHHACRASVSAKHSDFASCDPGGKLLILHARRCCHFVIVAAQKAAFPSHGRKSVFQALDASWLCKQQASSWPSGQAVCPQQICPTEDPPAVPGAFQVLLLGLQVQLRS